MHRRRLREAQGAAPIRVLFLCPGLASWKVDTVFERMLADPAFEPLAAICPQVRFTGAVGMERERANMLAHFDAKGFPVLDLTQEDGPAGLALIEAFDPHLAFFTNPHPLSHDELHAGVYRRFLSCYLPYSHEVVSYGGDQNQFNQESHNSFWRVFVPHATSARTYARTRAVGARGVSVTGFPCCEPLIRGATEATPDPWRPSERPRKRIIWAPHWLIKHEPRMATIYEIGDIIDRIAEDYRDEVQWAMRPHGFLRAALAEHPDWGEARAAALFERWSTAEHLQIEEGDYVPLFLRSDAMIHDSGSFLAEYLYVDRPVMYLRTPSTSADHLNAFGLAALEACEIGRTEDEIRRFVEGVIAGRDTGAERRRAFLDREVRPLFGAPPSERICEEIRRAFQ